MRKLRKKEGFAYVSRLRTQHMKMNAGTEWAQPVGHLRGDGSEVEDSGVVVVSVCEDPEAVDSLLKTNDDLVVKGNTGLLHGLLEYSRLVDVDLKNLPNGSTHSVDVDVQVKDPPNCPVNSVQFHRNSQLLLVGLSKTLRLFQVDGEKHEMLESILFKDIRKAAFLPDGSHTIISGRRKFAYSYDLVKARVDEIGPLAAREEKSLEAFETKELVGTLKTNGTVRSAAFTDDRQQLLSSGGDGRIYHWDRRTRSCFYIGVDEGCINGTALCVSPAGNLFAAGSGSGIVNI